jgi:hypothetical protein
MMRIARQWCVSVVFKAAIASLTVSAACGDDSDEDSRDATVDSTMDAATDAGGDADSTPPARDSSSGQEDGSRPNPYTCEPRQAEPGGSVDEGGLCCAGAGVCTKSPSEQNALFRYDECSKADDLRCVPRYDDTDTDAGADDMDAGADDDLGVTCEVEAPGVDTALEGRCIPECFVKSDPLVEQLGRGSCLEGSACVPCYSPITGASTGACELGDDAPTLPAPPGYMECGENIGYCVRAETLIGAVDGSVPEPEQLECAEGFACAPKSKLLDPRSCFTHCRSFGDGACVPKFQVPEAFREILPTEGCLAGEVCAPCINPMNGAPTGACDA